MKTLIIVGIVVLIGGAAALGVAQSNSAIDAAYAHGKAEGAKVAQAELKAQFGKGMKAGVEYEDWFCANPEVAASLGKSGK